MEISPQQVRSASFRTAKKGLDPDEVTTYLRSVADALEAAQNQATAMEARARAAVARLQELSAAAAAPEPATVSVEPDQAETISRTLLLAQRTADTTVAEAKAEAERLLTAARDEAASTIDSTREMSARLLDEARDEARTVSAEERQRVEGEVQALLARRDFLESDVDHLERFLVDQRDRLRDAAAALVDIAERVPGGLGQVRRPLLSAAASTETDETVPMSRGIVAPSEQGAADSTSPASPGSPDDEAAPPSSPGSSASPGSPDSPDSPASPASPGLPPSPASSPTTPATAPAVTDEAAGPDDRPEARAADATDDDDVTDPFGNDRDDATDDSLAALASRGPRPTTDDPVTAEHQLRFVTGDPRD